MPLHPPPVARRLHTKARVGEALRAAAAKGPEIEVSVLLVVVLSRTPAYLPACLSFLLGGGGGARSQNVLLSCGSFPVLLHRTVDLPMLAFVSLSLSLSLSLVGN